MMVYLDNSSTTKPLYFAKDYSDKWLNSNTNYAHAEQKALDEARDRVKSCLGVKSGRVIVGSCSSGLVQDLFNKIKDNA